MFGTHLRNSQNYFVEDFTRFYSDELATWLGYHPALHLDGWKTMFWLWSSYIIKQNLHINLNKAYENTNPDVNYIPMKNNKRDVDKPLVEVLQLSKKLVL